MFKRLISSALIFGAAALAPPVLAQSAACFPRDALIQSLKTTHGEHLTGGGLPNWSSCGALIKPEVLRCL